MDVRQQFMYAEDDRSVCDMRHRRVSLNMDRKIEADSTSF
jgi:hypothetical protein